MIDVDGKTVDEIVDEILEKIEGGDGNYETIGD